LLTSAATSPPDSLAMYGSIVSSILKRLILDDSGSWVLITGYSAKVCLVEAIVEAGGVVVQLGTQVLIRNIQVLPAAGWTLH